MNRKYLIIFMFLAVISSCGYKYEEIARITNSDGTIDAVAVDLLTGATVATPTRIYVGKKGFKINGEPVLKADHVDGLSMAWNGNDNLVVRAREARVFSFINSVDVKTSGGIKKVSIVLKVENKIE